MKYSIVSEGEYAESTKNSGEGEHLEEVFQITDIGVKTNSNANQLDDKQQLSGLVYVIT